MYSTKKNCQWIFGQSISKLEKILAENSKNRHFTMDVFFYPVLNFVQKNCDSKIQGEGKDPFP